ncbi:MFS transporter [Rubripirellula sp.]|nr:MFS transporter [Rubripirellula sp.]MDB4634603.1 MFS transporter [Rubripirellula sp.]
MASQVSPIDPDQRLSWREKVGYGLGDTASNLYWKTFEFFLMYFYTDVFGIKAGAAGTMLLVTRIWDAINDPLVGYFADRTRTAWGSFRPYLLWMCIPFAITGVLTFYTPDLGDNGKLVYAYITYTLVMMAYTAINIPYGALMGVISASSLERTSVSTYRFVLAFVGGIIVQYFTLDLVGFFGGTESVMVDGKETTRVLDEQMGFFCTMVVFSVAAVILFLITFATTKERVLPEVQKTSTFQADLKFLLTSTKLHQVIIGGLSLLAILATQFSLAVLPWIVGVYFALSMAGLLLKFLNQSSDQSQLDVQQSSLELDFNDLLANRPWMVLFGFGLFQLMGAFVRGGAILYYFKYYCNNESVVPSFFVAGSLAAIAGMLLTKKLTSIFGKKMLMIYMNLGVAAITAAFFLLNPDDTTWMFALYIASSFIGGPSPVLLWSMYADTADYSEWRTRRRATGLVFSAATFSQKMGCAVGAAMTGFALEFFQYAQPVDGVEQLQAAVTLNGLCMMMSVIPAGFFLVAAICLAFYSISDRVLDEIECDLQARKNGQVPDA